MQQYIIELFEDLLEKQGLSRMYGRILAIIYLKEIKITQEQLEKESNFSRSSINKAVNTLQSVGYIRKSQLGEGKRLSYYTEWGPREILLQGIHEYVNFFKKVQERFSTIFEKTSTKIEGMPSRRLKEFIEQLPKAIEILKNALKQINELQLAL
ncbi:MAG TPA: MarR family transcriptional regulator [Candidatus Deferrimicrobium sp.]|nr:MarR family transcriptional regulator [Candidatus Deferrimicrobium sp.]